MPWGAVAGAVVTGVMANKRQKDAEKANALQAGQSAATKDPWAPAAPWLKQNLGYGQALQQQYQANPFSQAQRAAYGNSAAQGDYMRSLVPSLLGQMQSRPVGFDRTNPQARQAAWNWNGLLSPDGSTAIPGLMQNQQTAGLLAANPTSIDQAKAQADAAAYVAANDPAAAAAAAEKESGLYKFQKKYDPLGAKVTKMFGF